MNERILFARLPASLAMVSMFVLFVGCGRGDGLKRVRVHGSVTYQGQPVMDGQIRFYPESGTEGPLTIAKIVDGKYSHNANGGVPAGTHRIHFHAWDPNLPIPLGPTDPGRPQLLPPQDNKDSEMMFEIEYQRGWLTKDFELP